MLFVFDHARHPLHAFEHFRISAAHQLRDKTRELIEKWLFDAGQAGMAHGAAHDFAQHVAAAVIGGENPIVNQEGGGARVIGDDAQGGIDTSIIA
jgi:hypothetical protein